MNSLIDHQDMKNNFIYSGVMDDGYQKFDCSGLGSGYPSELGDDFPDMLGQDTIVDRGILAMIKKLPERLSSE